ncbi:MAG TPA: nucleoside transporter C-terminal domain-containing protein [Hyphomicrobiaceae bacterium]|nr:nucleoside transporter C-terminal domain-containing protein [Hyphomicrobiaceae bacterium]
MTLALQSALGIILIPALAWAISENRDASAWPERMKIIVAGLFMQFALVGLLLAMPWTRGLFDALGAGVLALQSATDAGARLVFGYLAGGPAPFEQSQPHHGFILAFRVLPMILVLSALVRLLYHWGVLQRIVWAFAWALQRTFGIGGPLSTAAAASVFLGPIEAPLLIRPYLASMSRGALFAAMAVSMATVAGTVMALYASILAPVVPGAAGHLVAASIINVPAALTLARVVVPADFTGGPQVAEVVIEDPPESSIDAIAQGTTDGVRLVVGVAAMLIVMVSLVALVNAMLGGFGDVAGAPLTAQRILGIAAMPIAFVIGIPSSETAVAGGLIAQKVVLNEFLAYLELVKTPATALSDRSRLLLTYALCGFANLGSLGILIGGLSVMLPARRSEIVSLAPRAMFVGFLATLLSAAVVGTTVWN